MFRIGTIIVLVILASYGAFKALPLLSGPELTITSPADGQSFAGGFVQVSGVANHTENLALDGAPLLIDETGRFSTSFSMPPGGAILSLTATDRFGKTETVRRSIFVP